MSSKTQIAEHWQQRVVSGDPVIGGRLALWGIDEDDTGKVVVNECFACGRTGNMQIHHILPLATLDVNAHGPEKRSLRLQNDELNNVDNLHLLCRQCHKLAPHTNDSRIYWMWFNSRPCHLEQLMEAFNQGLKQSGVTDYELEVLWKEFEADRGILKNAIEALDFFHPETTDLIVVTSVTAKIVADIREKHPLKT